MRATFVGWAERPALERVPHGVALTFDDGPDPDCTPSLLDLLDELGLRATFFVVGEQLMRNHAIARDALARGHELGLHGFEHVRHDSLPGRMAADDVARAIGTFEVAVGRRPRWFRPPYGVFNEASYTACADLGLEPAYWSAWGLDWEAISAERIAELVERDLEDGSVVLLHDSARYAPRESAAATLEALPLIAERARATGLALGSLGELAQRAAPPRACPRVLSRMPPLIDQLLLPQKLASRGLDDLRQIADAAVVIANELAGLHSVLKPMSDDLDGLREAFEGSNRELAALREAMTPELRGVREAAEPLHGELSNQRQSIDALDEDLKAMGEKLASHIDRLPRALAPLQEELGEMRDVVEPLAPAAERVGRLAERMPGPGRKR